MRAGNPERPQKGRATDNIRGRFGPLVRACPVLNMLRMPRFPAGLPQRVHLTGWASKREQHQPPLPLSEKRLGLKLFVLSHHGQVNRPWDPAQQKIRSQSQKAQMALAQCGHGKGQIKSD
jgi:hypothetical protein